MLAAVIVKASSMPLAPFSVVLELLRRQSRKRGNTSRTGWCLCAQSACAHKFIDKRCMRCVVCFAGVVPVCILVSCRLQEPQAHATTSRCPWGKCQGRAPQSAVCCQRNYNTTTSAIQWGRICNLRIPPRSSSNACACLHHACVRTTRM